MESKEKQILEAALDLFKVYGFKKVALGEIAKASGISRPTLYAVFANKEALITRLVHEVCLEKKAKTERVIVGNKSLKQQLEALSGIWITDFFAFEIDDQNFRELMTTVHLYAPEALEEVYSEFGNYLTEILKPHLSQKSKMNANELTQVIVNAIRGFKSSPANVLELKKLVKGLILMTLSALGQ